VSRYRLGSKLSVESNQRLTVSELPKMHPAARGEVFDPALVQQLLDAAYDQRSLRKRVLAEDLLSSVAVTR
jgi:hypothetical protein